MSDNIAPLPPDTGVAIQSVDFMIDQVARIVGAPDDPDAREQAIGFLDRAANWMNLSGLYMFRRIEIDYESFTLGDTTVEQPTDWGWPDDIIRLYDSNGALLGVGEWLDWDTFKSAVETQNTNSVPAYFSIRSEMDGLIHFHLPIDTTKVAKITIPYFARMQKPSEASELLITPESQEALICGAEAFFVRHRYIHRRETWTPVWDMFLKAITMAKGASWRYRQVVHSNAEPDESGHLVQSTFTNVQPATAFIALR